MSEKIEFLVYCVSNGDHGLLPYGEMWKRLHEEWEVRLNPRKEIIYANGVNHYEDMQVQLDNMSYQLGQVELENDRLYGIRQHQDAEINSLKSRLKERDDAIAKLEAELETARAELNQLQQSQIAQSGNQLEEANSEYDPTTFTDWLNREIEKDCCKPVQGYKSPNAGTIYTRSQMLNLVPVSWLAGLNHQEKFRDRRDNWWQCLRKEEMREPLSSFQFHGVKVLFVGLESESDYFGRYI